MGEIFIWRTDSNGWYELLRRMKRDVPLSMDSKPPVSSRDTMGQLLGRSSVMGGGTAVNRSMMGTVSRSVNGLKTASVASTGIASVVGERVALRGTTGIDAILYYSDLFIAPSLPPSLLPFLPFFLP